MGELDTVGQRQEGAIDFGPADHGDMRRIGDADCLGDAARALGAVVGPCLVAGQDDMPPTVEQAGQAVEGLAPHDHRQSHGETLEAPQIGRQMPGQRAVATNRAIGGAGQDKDDLGMVHGASLYGVTYVTSLCGVTCVTWPILRPGKVSVLP